MAEPKSWLVASLAALASIACSAARASDDPLVQPLVEVAKNREPVLVHATQLADAQRKLDAFVKRTGRRPNVLVFIMDDVG